MEVAKYYGEILIGLCVLNGEMNALKNSPIKSPGDVKSFIVPSSPSFTGIDSLFKMKDGSFISISSKSGAGASASFHSNLLPKLVSYVENGGKVKNPLLKYMVEVIRRRNDMKNMEFIYTMGLNFLMGKYLKGGYGTFIKNNPYSIYTNISNNKITIYEEYVMEAVKKGKWPIMKNMKKIEEKLPNSLTYFLCQNLAAIVNSDNNALQLLKQFLTYWQANLDSKKFASSGDVTFKMVQTNRGRLSMMQGKGSMNSVKSEQGRFTYIIK